MRNIKPKIKRLFYQLFVVGYGKVELFFLLTVVSAFAFYPSRLIGAVCAFFIPIFFIRNKRGLFVALIVLLLNFFASNALLVTGVKLSESERKVYTTTSGTLVSDSFLKAGDVVFGGYEKQIYVGEDRGRFAGGYYIGGELKRTHVPFVGWVLEKRQELSVELFERSGGMLRLTQAVALGDRQFLGDELSDKYQHIGLGHLLAVSGLHVGLYTMVIYLLLGFLPYKLRLVPAGLFLLLIIPFTGFKIPVLRAGLIGFAIVASRFFDLSTDNRKLLLFFAGIFILISPAMIVSPSFLLSFSAVYGLLHMDSLRYPKSLEMVLVGLVATLFIIPAGSVTFGSFNVSSILTTVVMIPVLSLQLVTFLFYPALSSLSLEPLIILERLHISLIHIFSGWFQQLYTIYHTTVFWGLLMMFFLYVCLRLRVLWFAFLLLAVPYLPINVADGGYFPNMGRSKGFVVKDEKVHIFFKGHHSDFVYKFLPYLGRLGVRSADSGSINIFTAENIFIPIKDENEDYGWVCVNKVDDSCKAVYHTRSDSYKCDDEQTHILYKNKCKTEKTYLLSEIGDLKIDNQGE